MTRFVSLPIVLLVLLVSRGMAQEVPTLTQREIAPGIHVVQGHPHGNVLAIATSAGLVVVDAQAPATAAPLDSILTALGPPVTMAISTHYHEDHLGANPRFRESGATVLGHRNLTPQARKDTTVSLLRWERKAALEDALPTLEVTGDTVLTVGGREIHLLYVPAAHTDGDLAVWVPGANLIHTGDVYELDAYPFIDFSAGGTIDGMIAAVDRLAGLADERTVIVPGHGHVSDRDELRAYGEMLRYVRDQVRAALDAGRTVEETMDAGITTPFDADRGGERAGRRFVGITYISMGGTP